MCFLILSVFRRSDELETVFFWCKSDKNNCVIPRIAGYQKRRTSPNSTSQEVLLFFSLLRAPPLFPAITCSSHLPAFRTYLPWSVCMCAHHSIHTSLQSKHQPKTNRRRRIQHCVCFSSRHCRSTAVFYCCPSTSSSSSSNQKAVFLSFSLLLSVPVALRYFASVLCLLSPFSSLPSIPVLQLPNAAVRRAAAASGDNNKNIHGQPDFSPCRVRLPRLSLTVSAVTFVSNV